VLLFMLAHPRWEMVFQPKYAAYLNLIEPWWKILRSLALAGHRFERWGMSPMRLCKQLSTGTLIVTPSAGDIAADTVHAASPASLARQYPRDFPDKPLSRSCNSSRPSRFCRPSRF